MSLYTVKRFSFIRHEGTFERSILLLFLTSKFKTLSFLWKSDQWDEEIRSIFITELSREEQKFSNDKRIRRQIPNIEEVFCLTKSDFLLTVCQRTAENSVRLNSLLYETIFFENWWTRVNVHLRWLKNCLCFCLIPNLTEASLNISNVALLSLLLEELEQSFYFNTWDIFLLFEMLLWTNLSNDR